MSDRTLHSEWLSLIDVSGPFLAEPVLKEAFPQGLGGLDAAKKTMLRQAYDEWREARDLDDPLLPKIHAAWIDLVLKQGLELDEQGKADVLKPRAALPETLACTLPEHGITLRPDFAVVDAAGQPLMLVVAYDPDVSLTDAKKGDGWAASPAERMVELCRATQVRLGLLTNGEHWIFVDAPVNAATTMANWYARLWGQETLTLQAFVNLLGIRRFFVDRSEQLPALLDKSLEHQDEVTDALGEQVRRAVEVLIQALDRADVDRKRELLEGIEPSELYEAGLTVMMRIVFLLSAEERGLLLMGDPRYEASYAISTLRLQLRANSDEILERRQDAWSRLLSVFRAVYGGIDHDSMRLPALGGSLFDPDRYPFLEGRAKGSSWKTDAAKPLPIDNRTVLLLLEAVQLFQGRTLSYLALDVEQIGYVYEGLLERTAVRAGEVTLDLAATKNADNPWVTLPEIDDAAAKGGKAVEELLKERTGSAITRVRNDLSKQVDDASVEKLLAACHGDRDLRDRIKPYFHLLRTDPWGYPLVYPKDTFMVRTGSDRRETGTHYTPKPLTEAIVTETLEPLVYIGPADGKPREEWKLRSPAELLDLKICDPAMGSGAFLVQVCRWLSERLVESWQAAEAQGKAITAAGDVLEALGVNEPLRPDPAERLLAAKRLIAERCLYGVDMNPLAVELAKLAVWLITLAKGRPVSFLDHNFRCGDSLLGIESLKQLQHLSMQTSESVSPSLFGSEIASAIDAAVRLRVELRALPIRDIHDVEAVSQLNQQSSEALSAATLIAHGMIAEVCSTKGMEPDLTSFAIDASNIVRHDANAIEAVAARVQAVLFSGTGSSPSTSPREPFHWPLAFPEVFQEKRQGFDAVVGNPPFLGGKRISTELSRDYERFLKKAFHDSKGAADLSAYFFRRSFSLLNSAGSLGLIATNSITEGPTRRVGLAVISSSGGAIFSAKHGFKWPGSAKVIASYICISKSTDRRRKTLNGEVVEFISTRCDPLPERTPAVLPCAISFSDGKYLSGDGFRLDRTAREQLVASDPNSVDVIKPYLNADLFSAAVSQVPSIWAIDLEERNLEEATRYKAVFDHLDRHVRPYRESLTGQIHEDRFWLHWDKRAEFFKSVAGRERVLICPRVAKYLVFEFYEPNWIFSDALKVFDIQDFATFGVLQSTIHYVWARQFSSSLKVDLRYSTDDALRTFPLPSADRLAGVDQRANDYHHARSHARSAAQLGMTDTFNRFNDPDDLADEIVNLRNASARLDEAVLQAYGWNDVELAYGFHTTPYGVRFTVSEMARRRIIAHLLDCNEERAAASTYRTRKRPSRSREAGRDTIDLLNQNGGERHE